MSHSKATHLFSVTSMTKKEKHGRQGTRGTFLISCAVSCRFRDFDESPLHSRRSENCWRANRADSKPRPEYKYLRSIRGEVEKYDRSRDFHTYSFWVPGSSIHIKSTGLLAPPGQCLSYITFLSEGGMVLTRHYPSIKSQPHVFPFYRSNPSGNSRGMRIYPGEKGTTSGRCCSAS